MSIGYVENADYSLHADHLFQRRPNIDLQPLPLCTELFLSALCCLTAPFSLCLGFRKITVAEDTLALRCGIPSAIYREPGCLFVNPCCLDTVIVDMRLQDAEIKNIIVNDSVGSPVQVSAQFVYHITDHVKANLVATNDGRYLRDQGETTLRAIIGRYPYDSEDNTTECLRRPSETIQEHLKNTLQAAVSVIGIHIDAFRITHICYEKSMEKLLLARQEAHAEVTARTAIAEGASGIVQETLTRLHALGITLSEGERNRFATNLTLMIVNHGHTTINLFENTISPEQSLRMPSSNS